MNTPDHFSESCKKALLEAAQNQQKKELSAGAISWVRKLKRK
jgi:hypothetical protein